MLQNLQKALGLRARHYPKPYTLNPALSVVKQPVLVQEISSPEPAAGSNLHSPRRS